MGIYVYAHNTTDIRGTGLAGDLQPYEAYFEEEKNGISTLTIRMAYDKHKKWEKVRVGNLLKAKVPVRTPPKIENNAYSNTLEIYRVVSDALQRFSARIHLAIGGGITATNLQEGEEVVKVDTNKYATQKGVTGTIPAQNVEPTGDSVTVPASLINVESQTGSIRVEYQLFTITEVKQDLTGIQAIAEHISYQLRDNYCDFNTESDISCAAICDAIMEHKVSADNRFSLYTNCTEIQKNGIDLRQKNIIEALLDPEDGVCAKFGLSLLRDNFDLYALKNVGSDRGFVVEYSKNMIAIDYTENIEETYTRILPFGYDKQGNIVYMDGTRYVDSPYINNYSAPRVLLLDCSETARESDTMTLVQVKAELLSQANKALEDGVDIPSVTMDIDFLSLGDTEEYKQYRDLDKVYMFDRIGVKFKGRILDAEVIGIRHNVLTGALERVTIGSVKRGSNIRKIASWQVPNVDGSNIRLQSIRAEAIADDSISTEKVRNGSITVAKLDADGVFAKIAEISDARIESATIQTAQIENLDAVIAEIAQAEIDIANISFARIKDAIAESLITKDAIADKYFIRKLQVDNLQTITLSVANLVVKANDGNYYALDVGENGGVTATQTSVTSEEIAAGVTADGKRSIVETDLLVSDLSATNINGANALIDKILSRRIDVDSLFARQAFIGKLNTTDISNNQYLRLMVDDKLDDVAIGGRNYLRNSSDLDFPDYYISAEYEPTDPYIDFGEIDFAELED